ncbi:arginase family protein [Carboxydothermus ferrireducens]|uniref:Agmatinase n=1 Tax=Carboxydothermus ferrireducens DSM 11255 TaxID=1119529 RepID=A0ABX2R912_9THEO|nr:arginase family protein [Carboxydothermus ferrireducens]NYE56350.1 agmatinase [Carboxydothermus ferrireducens DSM 11255]
MGLIFKDVGVIDLDGSVTLQENLLLKFKPKIISLPPESNLKIVTSLENYQAVCQKLSNTVYGVNFCGLGEFHHLAYYLIKRVPIQEVAVVVFDNHPDLLPTFPGYISCGSWLLNVAELKKVVQIIVVGVTEISGLKSAPPTSVREKIILFLPQTQKKKIKKATIPVRYYDENNLWTEIHKSLKVKDIYISIDKDVLHPLDAVTTWEQGELRLNQLLSALAMLKEKYKIWGIDICGEYGSELLKIQRIGERWATSQNERANLEILEILLGE